MKKRSNGLTYDEALSIGLGDEHPESPMRTRNKYRAKPTVFGGIRYHSKGEANRARQLDADKACGLVSWWLGQVKFRLGCPENVYVVDFLVGYPTDQGLAVRAEDYKGFRTAAFNHNVRLWRSYGPFPLWVIERGKVTEIIRPGEPQ